MGEDYWFLFVFGTVFTIAVSVLFLYTLHLGLRRRRWWPLIAVSAVWLIGMVAYSAWDGAERRDSARRRAAELSAVAPPRPQLPTLHGRSEAATYVYVLDRNNP